MSNHCGALSKVAAFAASAMGVVSVPETAFKFAPWFTREVAAAKCALAHAKCNGVRRCSSKGSI